MSLIVLDPLLARSLLTECEANGTDRIIEVWEGDTVVPPLPNDEHQEVQMNLVVPLYDCIQVPGLGQVRPGVNVSDRAAGWEHSYRGPDVVVYLATNPAINHGTHWEGGPDFLVEIISPGEKPTAKFGFYASVNTREALIVHRDPWYLELFQLAGGTLVSAGRSELADPRVLASGVVPLTFQLTAGPDRPRIEVMHPPTSRKWSA